MPTKPTTEQLQAVIHAICKVIAQIPCFHLFEEHIAQRFSNTEAEISLRAITHNAVLDSTLMSLRVFNEFFASDRRQDDIRASDFPGISMQTFLAPDDATAINKYLAHITATRADIVTKHWFLDDMVVWACSTALNSSRLSKPPFRPPPKRLSPSYVAFEMWSAGLSQRSRSEMHPTWSNHALRRTAPRVTARWFRSPSFRHHAANTP